MDTAAEQRAETIIEKAIGIHVTRSFQCERSLTCAHDRPHVHIGYRGHDVVAVTQEELRRAARLLDASHLTDAERRWLAVEPADALEQYQADSR